MRISDVATEFDTVNSHEIYDGIYDGGSFHLDPSLTGLDMVEGRYVVLRRNTVGAAESDLYDMRQMRVYQTPNLLNNLSADVKITDDTTSAMSNFEAINLL